MADSLASPAVYTYDLTTPVGMIRLTIGDVPQAVPGTAQYSAFYTDAELQALLASAGGSVPMASVTALENWSRRLSSRPKRTLGDFVEDWSASAKALMDLSIKLRGQIGDEDDDPVVFVGGGMQRSLW